MRDGYLIADADRHVHEPPEIWRAHLPPEMRSHALVYETLRDSGFMTTRGAAGEPVTLPLLPRLMLDGRPIWQNMSDRSRAEMLTRGARRIEELHAGGRPELQLRDMDRAGIDIAFLYPTVAHFVLAIDDLDPPVARAYASAYNEWLRGFCSLDPRRLRGVGVLARQDISGMTEELRRVADFGFRTVVLRPNPIGGKTLGHPDYEPFWAECERMAMSVAVHEGTHARAPSAGADRFTSRFALHACSHPMEQMMAFLSLLEGGVFERHPSLRFAFLEAGCGWIPYWLFRLDEIEWKDMACEVAESVRRKPSEYFRRQCFVAIEPGEPYIADMIKYIGEDNLLFGTDFPHLDHATGIMDEGMALKASLPEAALRKILWDNPVRFYGVGS